MGGVTAALGAVQEQAISDSERESIRARPTEPRNEAEIAAVLEAIGPLIAQWAASPEGEPLQFPPGVAQIRVKMDIAEVLDLMDNVVDKQMETDPSLVGEEFTSEMLGRTEAIYDRVFEEHGLTGLVDEISRRVLISGEEWVSRQANPPYEGLTK